MTQILTILNTREVALIIWSLVISILLLLRKDIRNSLVQIVKAFFDKAIIRVFIPTTIYMIIVIVLLNQVGLWNVSLIKDTVFWGLGTGLILFVNINKVDEKQEYFSKLVVDNFKFLALLAFVTNLYTFSLPVELIMLPVLSLVVMLSAVAGTKKETKSVKDLLDIILGCYGIVIIALSIWYISQNIWGYITAKNMYAFIIPILLTLAYIPALYTLVLYMNYEELFLRVNNILKNDIELRKLSKREILFKCNVQLERIVKFRRSYLMRLLRVRSVEQLNTLFNEFNKAVFDEEESASISKLSSVLQSQNQSLITSFTPNWKYEDEYHQNLNTPQ